MMSVIVLEVLFPLTFSWSISTLVLTETSGEADATLLAGRDRLHRPGADDEVCTHDLLNRLVERRLDAVREHGDEDDETESDHECGRRRRGAAGVAHRVLAGQQARLGEQALERPADGPGQGADEPASAQSDADEQQHDAAGHHRQPAGRRPSREQTGHQQRHAEHRHDGRSHDAAPPRALLEAAPAAPRSAARASRVAQVRAPLAA